MAVTLLLVQTVFGAGACLAQVRALTGGSDAPGFFGAICSPYVPAAAETGEDGQPAGKVPARHECPLCLSFNTVILTVDAPPPGAPEGGPVLAEAPVTEPAGIFVCGYRNRGPPSSLMI